MADPHSMFRVEKVAAPLRQSVTDSIRNAIAVGVFEAGARLPERELCELTGVSRTLVREALRQLESEGLIEVRPHRGPIVARLNRRQAEGIYQVRIELEGLACQLFAEHADEDQFHSLEKAFAALKDAIADGDAIEKVKAKNNFYATLIDGTGNEALGQTLKMLNSRIMLLRSTSLQAPGRAPASISELSELLEALKSGDGPRARELGRFHVQQAAATALAFLPEDDTAE